MKGLIKKDFFIIKANIKVMAIIFIVYLIMAMQGSFDITFIMPLIGLMLFISTFSYDDFNNWNSYASTLPNGRKNVVKAKYIASIIMTIFLAIVSIVISIAINYTKINSIKIDETMSKIMGTMLSVVIIISLLYPIMFKFGPTKGRIILFAGILIISTISGLLSQFIDMSNVINTINMIDQYTYIAIPTISVILLYISYLISNKIYLNKEF